MTRLREEEVQVHHLIPRPVSNEDEEGAMIERHIVTNQRRDTLVELFAHLDEASRSWMMVMVSQSCID